MFGKIRNIKFSLDGENSIANMTPETELEKALRAEKDIYIDMQRAEMEIEYMRLKKAEGWAEAAIAQKLDEMSYLELFQATAVKQDWNLYQTIIKLSEEDEFKSPDVLLEEIYKHVEAKTDVNRNMLALIFSRNPEKYKNHDQDVERILKNNISWPKNYYPKKYAIKRPAPKKSKEEIDRLALKEKHRVLMQYLPKAEIDNVIDNLQKVADTQDAMTTYKLAGWKSNFVKKKRAAHQENRSKELQLRAECLELITPAKAASQSRNFFQNRKSSVQDETNSKSLLDEDTGGQRFDNVIQQGIFEKMKARRKKQKANAEGSQLEASTELSTVLPSI